MRSATGRTRCPAARSSLAIEVQVNATPLPSRAAPRINPPEKRGPFVASSMPWMPAAVRKVGQSGQCHGRGVSSWCRSGTPVRLPFVRIRGLHTGNISSSASFSAMMFVLLLKDPHSMITSASSAVASASGDFSWTTTSVSGASASKRSIRGTSQAIANSGGERIRIVLRSKRRRVRSTVLTIWAKAVSSPFCKCLPAAVRRTPRPSRSRSTTPRSFSRLLIWRLTAPGVTESSAAATDTDPRRATTSKARMALREGKGCCSITRSLTGPVTRQRRR